MTTSQLKSELQGLKKLVEKCMKIIEKLEASVEGENKWE